MWSEIVFVVERDAVDAWSDALLEAGAASIQAEDADADSGDEAPLFGEPGEPAPASGWQRTRLAALVAADTDAPALLAHAAAICARAMPAEFELRAVPDQDWVQATQSQFAPIPVGRRLWITPSWHLPAGHDAGAAAPPSVDGRHAIVLDPGLAFGTGSHPTTRLCLEWLDEHLRGGERVIDYGCGSGILAIAAARLGAASVCAIDIDPQALDSARRNAAVNAVTLDIRATGDPQPEPADIVVANILANPLRILAPLLCALVAPGGRLVLAGLLDRQAQEIAACYPAIGLQAWRSLDGWTCLAGVRRS